MPRSLRHGKRFVSSVSVLAEAFSASYRSCRFGPMLASNVHDELPSGSSHMDASHGLSRHGTRMERCWIPITLRSNLSASELPSIQLAG